MRFKYHFIIGGVASLILVQFFKFSPFSGLIIFISSWLIDIDHYLWYMFEFKDWNPVNALKWRKRISFKWKQLSKEEKKKFRRGVYIFHGIIFWMILFVGSFFHKLFLWIFIGVTIHIIIDWIDLVIKDDALYEKMFPLYVIIKNKNKKRLRGL